MWDVLGDDVMWLYNLYTYCVIGSLLYLKLLYVRVGLGVYVVYGPCYGKTACSDVFAYKTGPK